jgi:hypothetical protein
MAAANVPLAERYIAFREAFTYVPHTDGLVLTTINGKAQTRYEHFGVPLPNFASFLREWGEAGTVTTKTKTTPKLHGRGVICMFVGYSPTHSGDTYRMLDWKTKRVHVTRDIIWLKHMFFDAAAPLVRERNQRVQALALTSDAPVVTPGEVLHEVDDNELDEEPKDDDDDDDDGSEAEDDEDDIDPAMPGLVTRSGRVSRPSRRVREEREAQAAQAKRTIESVEEVNAPMVDFDYEIQHTEAKRAYYSTMRELGMLTMEGQHKMRDFRAAYEQGNYNEEVKYVEYTNPVEYANVGAATGGGFEHTSELKPMKYKVVMQTGDTKKW